MSNKYYNCLERNGTKYFELEYTFEQYPCECCPFEKLLRHLSCQAVMPSCITYCESVFRKSLIENVVVFLTNGRTEQHSLRVDSWDRYILYLDTPYLFECGVLCRLFLVRSFHNLHVDKRSQLHTFFII